jgi:hypothetical protein
MAGKGQMMIVASLILSAAVSGALVGYGWGNLWLTDLALLVGGVFAGHVLTEVLNDPSQ